MSLTQCVPSHTQNTSCVDFHTHKNCLSLKMWPLENTDCVCSPLPLLQMLFPTKTKKITSSFWNLTVSPIQKRFSKKNFMMMYYECFLQKFTVLLMGK